ncbi:hypothetical protein JW710_03460 [Candidatus Dojkabacteria bacterium]|nr:hypothetical protein [Candidatus Dojkabacteria bacterium]
MAISSEDYSKIGEKIRGAKKILVCINNRSSLDTHLAALSFVFYLRDMNKNALICVNGKLSAKHEKLFKDAEVDYKNALEPLNYVISIDHSGGEIEKVSYDDKDGKFNLYITPTDGVKGFDFDDVSYSYGGTSFDLVFVFGARSLRWLRDLYKNNKEVFDKNTLVNINNLKGAQEFGEIRLVDTEISVCEIVYGLLNAKSTLSSTKIMDLLIKGVVDHFQLFQRGDFKISSVETLMTLVKAGADLKDAIQNLYFSRDIGNFEITRKAMVNMKYDKDSKLAWSGVSLFDINRSGIDRDSFVLDGRIIFNISNSFDLAFVMYEVADNEVWVEFESNLDKYNARNIMSSYSPSGNASRVFFTVSGKSMLEVEQEILKLLKETLGVSGFAPVTGASDASSGITLEGEEQVLTEDDENGNNTRNPENGDEEDEPEGSVLVTPPPITPS